MHVHVKTLETQRGRTHGAWCAQPWFRTAEPLVGTSLRELDYNSGLQSVLRGASNKEAMRNEPITHAPL